MSTRRWLFERFRGSGKQKETVPANTPSKKRDDRGLLVLWEPQDGEAATIDIVAVHGLAGHRLRTWTHIDPETNEETLWLRDLLPQHFPTARIMTFGYLAEVWRDNVKYPLVTHAETLLQGLLVRRERQDETWKNRPIIFVGHSMGGILIKQALLKAAVNESRYASIHTNTLGIAFFGTPHGGSHLASVLSVLAAITPGVSSTLIKFLAKDSEPLNELSRDFSVIGSRYKIVSFYEEEIYPGLSRQVVPLDSAIVKIGNEAQIKLRGHHQTMCLFGKDDDHFEGVWTEIREIARSKRSEARETERLAIIAKNAAREEIELYRTSEVVSREEVQCLDDLKAPDYQWFRESKVRTAVHGTFDHLVEESQLSMWKSHPESCLLWVRGQPGCGKTTFAKFVLEDLEKELIDTQDANNMTQGRTAVLYFFFYGQDEDCNTELGLLRALIDQLLMVDSNLYQHILPHYQKLSTKFSEESGTLWSIFTAMVLNRGFSTIYCIIDAFDECETGAGLNDYHPTLEKIKRLVGKKYRSGNILKFLVTSRPTSAMAASMYDFPVMTIEPRREAIDLFIDSETVVLPDNIRQLVRLSLKGKSGKSFLWVSIITRRIRRMNKHQLKPKKLQDFIERLPTELNRTYDSIFGRIMEEMRPLLLWILYSPRSMTMKQLEEALATEPDCKSASKLSEYRVDLSIDGLEADSEGLIEVNTDRRSRFRVSFVHQTVKEFLLDTRLLSSEETTDIAQIYLAKTCLTYLNFDDFAQRPLDQTMREKTFPLYKPAAENWFRFVHQAVREEKAQLSTELMELVDPLLELESTTSKTWRDQLGRRLVAVQYPSDLAIELDVDWLLSYILKGETDRITNELSSTAFQKAAQNFDTRILHLLFEHNLSKDGTLPSDMEDILLSAVRNECCGRDLITLIQQYYQHFTASEKVVLEALGNYTFGKDVIRTLLETNPSLEITNPMIEAAVRSGTHNRVTGSDLLSVFGSPDAIHNLPVGPLMWSPPDPTLLPHPENEALEYLLTSPRNPGVGISEEDLVNAVKNAHLGDRTLASLLSPRARDITITSVVRETAARNGKCGLQLVQLLLDFKPFRLDEPFLAAAASNRKQGDAMFTMFCERKLNFDLSETVLLAAAKEGSVTLMRFLLQHTSNSIIDDQLLIAACLNSNMGRTLELLLKNESTFELSESTKQQLVIAAKHNRWAGNLVFKLLVTHFQSLEVDKDVADALCFLAGLEPELLDMFLSNVVANFSEDAIEVMRADYQHEIVPCLLEQPLLAEIIESLETGTVDDDDEDEDEDSDIDAELEGKEELEEPAWLSVPYKPVMETLYCLTRTAGEIQAIKHGYCGTDDDVNVQVTVVASDAETRVSKRIKLN